MVARALRELWSCSSTAREADLLSAEPLSANDLSVLATDHGPAPMNIGAALVIEGGSSLTFEQVRQTIADRLSLVPRLRQRLQRGRPWPRRTVWVVDPAFDVDRHVTAVRLRDASDPMPQALLPTMAELVGSRLPHDRPLWRAVWLTGLPGDDAGLVIVLHHVVTDGRGGLSVLASLADEVVDELSPQRPSRSAPATSREHSAPEQPAMRRGRHHRSRMLRGLSELGVTRARPKFAARTSLNRPTGPQRRLTLASVPLERVVSAAHRRGCTVNDVVLTAVSGAMGGFLSSRGERPERLVISVPISSRRTAAAASLGNAAGVVPVAIPTLRDGEQRLAHVVTAMSAHRESASPSGTAPSRGASAGPLGLAFRVLARLRLFQVFIDHQRLVNTFVTNVRGPDRPATFLGRRVTAIVPVAVTPGNVGVTFDVLSYAGELLITVVGDPDVLTDQEDLTRRLREELRGLTHARA